MKNYDPGLVIATFKGVVFQGFASGTTISAERTTDTFTSEVGNQGDVVRSRSRDRRGRVTFTLQSASPTNALLAGFVASIEESDGIDPTVDVGPLLIKDLNGATLITAREAWIVRPANVTYADVHSPREWVIEAANLKILGGGAIR